MGYRAQYLVGTCTLIFFPLTYSLRGITAAVWSSQVYVESGWRAVPIKYCSCVIYTLR